jgi:hypothetical protein
MQLPLPTIHRRKGEWAQTCSEHKQVRLRVVPQEIITAHVLRQKCHRPKVFFFPHLEVLLLEAWREYVANQQQSLEPLVSVGLQPTAPVHSERRGTCERSRIRSDRVRSRIGRDKGSACRRSLLQGSRISRARSRNCRAHSCSGRMAASSCRWSLGTRSSLKVMRRCNRINRCY